MLHAIIEPDALKCCFDRCNLFFGEMYFCRNTHALFMLRAESQLIISIIQLAMRFGAEAAHWLA